jgi:hypothetical protein
MNDSYWSKRFTGARRVDAKELASTEQVNQLNKPSAK